MCIGNPERKRRRQRVHSHRIRQSPVFWHYSVKDGDKRMRRVDIQTGMKSSTIILYTTIMHLRWLSYNRAQLFLYTIYY